jgi:hypothetical protein
MNLFQVVLAGVSATCAAEGSALSENATVACILQPWVNKGKVADLLQATVFRPDRLPDPFLIYPLSRTI